MYYLKGLLTIAFSFSYDKALDAWADIATMKMEYTRDTNPDEFDSRYYSHLLCMNRLATYVMVARDMFAFILVGSIRLISLLVRRKN